MVTLNCSVNGNIHFSGVLYVFWVSVFSGLGQMWSERVFVVLLSHGNSTRWLERDQGINGWSQTAGVL